MSLSEPPQTRTLDEATRLALVDAVDAAKRRGWTQDDLRAWFDQRGVALPQYLKAKVAAPVLAEAASVFVQVSITGLPELPPRVFEDPYPDLPQAMKDAERWLLWRLEPNADPTKKPRKVPYYVTGVHRTGALDTPEDRARLATYEEACAALALGGDRYAGLGFALGADDTGLHWQGIDLDNLDQHPGLKFVAEDLPGYVERSPSGGGVHAIGYGRAFQSLGSNTTGIEAYAQGRYFTVTGEAVSLGDVSCLADFVEGRLAPLHTHRPQDTSAAATGETGGSLAGAMAVHDLRSALASMRSDDRDLWVRMGHALKGLGDQGRGLWLEWSQTSDKYDPADAARVWDSFRPERTGYQAVFAEAQRRGWVNPGTRRDEPAPRVVEQIDPETGEVTEVLVDDEADDEPFSAADLNGDPPPRRWIVVDWIPEGTVSSLYGDGGLGKTLLMQQLACAAAVGGTWLGMPVARQRVLAVLCEDERDELHRRQNDIKAVMGFPVGNPFGDLYLWPRLGRDNTLVRWNRDDEPTLTPFAHKLVSRIDRLQPDLLILDTLADFFGGNEINRVQVNYFVKAVLGDMIERRKRSGSTLSVILLGHPSVSGKSTGSGYSGSTAWNAAVRARMYLSRPEEGASDERILTRGKANYAKSGDETAIRLFYNAGALHACDDAEDGDSMLWAAKEEVCRAVDRAWNSSQPYSAQKGHKRHIYALLPTDLQRSGYGPQLARQAIRECEDDGLIGPGRDNAKRGYRTFRNGR